MSLFNYYSLQERAKRVQSKRIESGRAERREAIRQTGIDLSLARAETITMLRAQELTLMEGIQTDYRGLGDSIMFGGHRIGGDYDSDTEKDLTGFSALEGRIKRSRVLHRSNPFARSLTTNLVNYVVGEKGMQFHLVDPSKISVMDKVLDVWSRWKAANDFEQYQGEALRRALRDGAAYVRWFPNAQFRTVEPLHISPPDSSDTDTEQTWGIKVNEQDAATREGYWVEIDEQTRDLVPATEVDFLHWSGTDLNVLRPSPLLYDFIEYLEGADSVLKNMRELVKVQTSIAVIREHPEGMSGTQIASWTDQQADTTVTDGDTGTARNQEKWYPGMSMDVRAGSKLHFPAAQMAVDKMVGALEADLRAVCASLGLPEFLVSANSGSTSYAQLLAAEGPAVKTFESLQGWLGRFLAKMFWRVISEAATTGINIPDPVTGEIQSYKLPGKALKLLLTVNGPNVKTRDQFPEARTNDIYAKMGVISPQQIAASQGRDYSETMRQIEEHNTNHGDIMEWPPEDKPSEREKTGSEKRNAGGSDNTTTTKSGDK